MLISPEAASQWSTIAAPNVEFEPGSCTFTDSLGTPRRVDEPLDQRQRLNLLLADERPRARQRQDRMDLNRRNRRRVARLDAPRKRKRHNRTNEYELFQKRRS